MSDISGVTQIWCFVLIQPSLLLADAKDVLVAFQTVEGESFPVLTPNIKLMLHLEQKKWRSLQQRLSPFPSQTLIVQFKIVLFVTVKLLLHQKDVLFMFVDISHVLWVVHQIRRFRRNIYANE